MVKYLITYYILSYLFTVIISMHKLKKKKTDKHLQNFLCHISVSIIVIPTMICMPISGVVAEMIGRKPTLIIGQIFTLLGWTVLYFAKQFFMFLIGRFLIGVGTGICLPLIIIFNSEIAIVKMRGILSMITYIPYHIGVIFSMLMATTFSLKVLIILSSIPSIIFLGCSIFLPESPVWLMRKGQTESAKKALLTLRQASK